MGNSQGRPSKKFGGSNRHNGASISQSGQTRPKFNPARNRPKPATSFSEWIGVKPGKGKKKHW